MSSVTIAIIGLGGIGSWLVEPLIRFTGGRLNINEVILIDGDHYSAGNQARQCVHPKLTGMNKDSATALKMRQYFPNIIFREVPEFINTDNIDSIFTDRSSLYIFNCCDNNYCRKIVSEWASYNKHDGLTVISGGNELTDGNSHIQKTRSGYAMTKSLITSHPEIKDAPVEEDRGRMSCQQLANIPSSNQIIVTNFWAAAVMLQQFYLMCENTIVQETFFDIKTTALNAIKPSSGY